MTAYYPSQASYHSHHTQPIVYTSSSHGHGGYHPSQYAPSGDYYGQPSNVVHVPSHSHSSRRSRSRRHHHHHSPQVVSAVPMQPSNYSSHHSGGYHRHHLSFGERVRRFFGLAPRGPFKYKSNKGTWGFLGYSRRPRYTDAMTGVEVDRKGRPIYRV